MLLANHLVSAGTFRTTLPLDQSPSISTHCYYSFSSTWRECSLSRCKPWIRWDRLCSSIVATCCSSMTSQQPSHLHQWISAPNHLWSTTTLLTWCVTRGVEGSTRSMPTGFWKSGTLSKTPVSLKRELQSAAMKAVRTILACITDRPFKTPNQDSWACKRVTSRSL